MMLTAILLSALATAPAPLAPRVHRYPIPSPVGRWTLDGIYDVTMWPDGRWLATGYQSVWTGTWRQRGKQLVVWEQTAHAGVPGPWERLEYPWPAQCFRPWVETQNEGR